MISEPQCLPFRRPELAHTGIGANCPGAHKMIQIQSLKVVSHED